MQPQVEEEAAFPANAAGSARIYYAGGNGPHSGSASSGRSNSIGVATSPVHALAGIMHRRAGPASEHGTAIAITRAIAIPHNTSNATMLWLLLSHSRAENSSVFQLSKHAVRVGLLLKNTGTKAEAAQATEVSGAAMHQSELRPWVASTGNSAQGLAQNSAELVTAEVQWNGASFAQVFHSIDARHEEDLESVEVRLKIGLESSVVVYAFGFA